MDEYVLARFLKEEMRSRGWKQRDLAEASGLTRQVISTLVNRPLKRMIEPATVAGLAQALAEPADGTELTPRQRADAERQWGRVVSLKAAETIGLPVGEVVTVVRSPTNEELAELVRTRLGVPPSDAAAAPNHAQAAESGSQVSGEAGTSGDLRDPRRRTRGSDETHERPEHQHHPHLI